MVHVNKLEMRGFKSFGHKKESLPLSSGLTAIVGPNGNGKSNIVDAISFVLGQRSAKTLRASDFSDLIYHGSEGENGRRAASSAKVKLYIKDDDNSLSIDTDEVTISRKVDRDGRSTYRINGNRSTLQEIKDLISGSLIGSEGYNFVMQGDVGKFIKMSSEERRKIIDDLAGVAEFEDKKEKAVRELEKVETNLKSERGRLEELEKNMERLKKEREEALEYKELKKKLDWKKAALAQFEVNSFRENLQDIEDKIANKENKLEKLEEERYKLKESQKDLREERKKFESIIQEKRDSEALKKVERINSKIETLRESLESNESDYKTLSIEIEDIKERAEDLGDKAEEESPLNEIEEYTSKLEDLRRRFEDLAGSINSQEKGTKEFGNSISEMKKVLEDLEIVISELEEQFKKAFRSKDDFLQLVEETDNIEQAGSEFEQIKSKLVSLKSRRDDARRRIDDLEEKIAKNEDLLEEAEADADEVEREIEKAKDNLDDLDKRNKELENDIEDLDDKIKSIEDARNDLRTRKASLETNLEQANHKLEEYEFDDINIDGLSEKSLKKDVKEIEKKIDGLKPINERAIDAYEGVKDRHDSQKEHFEKLETEKQKLIDFMEEIDQKKTGVFMETYEQVSENFSEIFSELSPGGEGRLALENPDEPLEGGIEIEVKPKGKKLGNVASLSGGEKALTGLAFIFAIQRTKPSALYVFDELDAHLDPENQKEVAKMIKRFSEESQIIVVTLRDSMMSVADKLFGVNMDEENISHIVSVDLEEFEVEN